MASDVQICNMALAKIGEDSILSLTENSRSGRACNLLYSDIREAVLRSHPWNFAIARVELAQLTATPAFGFNYQYQLPSDFLKAINFDPEGNELNYKVEGKKVLTDESTVHLRYVKNVTDANEFDPLFRECLAARLAAELAVMITDSTQMMEMQYQVYQDKLAEARSMDAQDGTPENIEASSWLEARL